jgi:AraC-like DNA-binding protein/mannose-6-phosphate isomerase-like protein (cupin superfamily)
MITAVIVMNIGKRLFPGISISRSISPAFHNETFSIHTHTDAELFCFVSGKAVFHVEGSVYSLAPGDILLMRPTESHFIEMDERYDYKRIVIHFDPGILQAIDPENTLTRPLFDRKAVMRNHYPSADFNSDRYLQYLENMLSADADRLTAFANLILLLKEVCVVFEQVSQRPAQPDTVEYQIIHYINKNLDKELTLTELSKTFFLSRAQLCLRFKNATGTSVGKYISIKRLLLARQRILQGQKPTEVCISCGYQNYPTFYRAYTRFFGHSPKQENGASPI